MANATDKPPEDGSDTTNKFVSALVLNAIIGIVCLILFCLLRRKHKKIYAPRQLLVETPAPGKRDQSFFSWLLPAFCVKDREVFQYAGIDAVVHMRFLKLCFKISLVLMPYGIIVLIPVNYFGGEDLLGLDRIAVSNISPGSPKVWAHVVATWIYTLIICYLLHQEWREFIIYRQEFLSQGMGNQYAVLVRDLPTKVNTCQHLILSLLSSDFFILPNESNRQTLSFTISAEVTSSVCFTRLAAGGIKRVYRRHKY